MRQLTALEEVSMSPLRGHKEPAPDSDPLKDPKGKPVKDEPASEPVLVDEPVVEEPPAE
jgi:hypothetical protein